MKKLLIIAIALLFLPYFWHPFALNLNPDTGLTVMHMLRMVDARLSFSFDPSAAYANPIVQMLVDFHGIYRQFILFPIFYVLDFFGMGIREVTVGAVFVVTSVVLTLIMYRLMRSLIGAGQAWWWAVLLSVIPMYALQVKGGWWHIFVYPLFLAGLAAEHQYFTEKKRQWYAWFCVAVAAYTLADVGFVFGYLWYALYAAIYFLREEGSAKKALRVFGEMLWNWWTLVSIAVLLGSVAVTYVGARYLGAEFGIFARLLEKGGHMGVPNFGAIAHFMVQGMGLVGWLLFPAILLGTALVVVKIRKENSLLVAGTLYVALGFMLLVVRDGSGGAVYELYGAGVLIVVTLAYRLRSWQRYAVLGFLVFATYTQTLLYNFEYTPPAWLTHRFSFIRPGEPCQALWCSWHFAEPKNLGVTTAAFVVRDYLSIQPIPFVSLQENFYVRPKELFFYTEYQQGPSFSIGRRISYRVEDIAEARVILIATPGLMAEAPTAVTVEQNQKVLDFLAAHPEYRQVATVTKNGIDMIQIFERDSARALQVFSVEEYDEKFNEKYGNLRGLGHIDLG